MALAFDLPNSRVDSGQTSLGQATPHPADTLFTASRKLASVLNGLLDRPSSISSENQKYSTILVLLKVLGRYVNYLSPFMPASHMPRRRGAVSLKCFSNGLVLYKEPSLSPLLLYDARRQRYYNQPKKLGRKKKCYDVSWPYGVRLNWPFPAWRGKEAVVS